MTDPKGMKLMMDFLDGTDAKINFTGYAFGDWKQSVFMGINLPKMFGMMPPPKWFEMRKPVAGFIKGTRASTSKPPIIMLSEFHVKESERDGFISMYEGVAKSMKDQEGSIA